MSFQSVLIDGITSLLDVVETAIDREIADDSCTL